MQETTYELWDLIQIPKKSYIKMKKAFHCEIVWKVKNNEGRENGELQYKVWNPRILQLNNDEDNKTYGLWKNRVWDPRRFKH